MIEPYQGNFDYSDISILISAPLAQGVYYCGRLDQNNQLVPLYVGRAKGQGVTIKSRLQDHKKEDYWPDVTHFGFIVCSTDKESIDLEANQIAFYKPKYNEIGK